MTPHEKIKSNDFLCGWDMEHATREQTIAWLCQMIKNETEKPENEQDLDLISECSDYLNELSEDDLVFSEEKIKQGLEKIKQENQSPPTATVLPLKKGGKKWIKAVALLAAAFVALFSTLTVAAKTQGYSNAWEFVLQNIEKIFKLNTGGSMEGNGITLVKGNESIDYQSIDELIQKEGYDILYPSQLPNDIHIVKITKICMSDTRTVFSFQFDDENLSMSATNISSITQDTLLRQKAYKASDITFYIEAFPNGTYQATGYDETYEYRIIYHDYETLITILDNMKGINK